MRFAVAFVLALAPCAAVASPPTAAPAPSTTASTAVVRSPALGAAGALPRALACSVEPSIGVEGRRGARITNTGQTTLASNGVAHLTLQRLGTLGPVQEALPVATSMPPGTFTVVLPVTVRWTSCTASWTAH